MLTGAAAFAAMAAYEKKERDEGKPVSHGKAKEILAGIAGFEVGEIPPLPLPYRCVYKLHAHQTKQATKRMMKTCTFLVCFWFYPCALANFRTRHMIVPGGECCSVSTWTVFGCGQ